MKHRWLKNFRDKSLLLKLLVCYLLLCGTVIVISCIFTYIILNKALSDQVIQSEMKAHTEANTKISFLLDDIESISDKIYINKGIRNLLVMPVPKLTQTIPLDETGDIRTTSGDLVRNPYLNDTVSIDNYFQSYRLLHKWIQYDAYIFGMNGYKHRYSSASGWATNLIFSEIKDSSWFHKILSEGGRPVLINGMHTGVRNLGNKILFARALIDINSGKPLGAFIMILDKQVLNDIYESLTQDYYTSIYIVDSDGLPMTRTPEEDMLDNTILKTNITDNGKSFFLKDTNQEVLYSSIKYSDWTLIEILDLNNLFVFMNNVQWMVVLFCTIGILIALLISYFIIKQFYNPVKKLHYAMQKIQKGNFKVDNLDISRKDEIGQLNRGLVEMGDALEISFDNLGKEYQAKRKAEIKMLQAQIKPHFLYNTLSSIRGLVNIGDEEAADRMIIALVKLLKNTFNSAEMVTVAEEIENLKNYGLIYQNRYQDFELLFQVEPSVLNYIVPKLIIQPLVENAIVHNLRNDFIRITVTAYETADLLVITVDDNGKGINSDEREQLLDIYGRVKLKTDSIGLKNVQDRIIFTFGQEYGLYIENKETSGARIRLDLPKTYGTTLPNAPAYTDI